MNLSENVALFYPAQVVETLAFNRPTAWNRTFWQSRHRAGIWYSACGMLLTKNRFHHIEKA